MIKEEIIEQIKKFNIEVGRYAGGTSLTFVGPNVRLLINGRTGLVECLQRPGRDGYSREGDGETYGEKWSELFEKADKIAQDPIILLGGPDSKTIKPVEHPYRLFNRTLEAYLT